MSFLRLLLVVTLLLCTSTAFSGEPYQPVWTSNGAYYPPGPVWRSPKKISPIRMLVVKHSREYIADVDADLAISAVRNSASQGLNIRVIGNNFVDGRLVSFNIVESLSSLTSYVNSQVTRDASPGDTLIVFTIGHGSPSGYLDNLGQRSQVMQVLAQAAESANQKIFWWQLSCHATASLPSITSLTPKQQELFTMVASSNAQQESSSGVQGHIMEKVFSTLAQDSSSIDPDANGVITAQELALFLNQNTSSGMGGRVFAASANTPIFGRRSVPQLPIVDRNNPQGRYDEEYVFLPND